MRLVRTDRGGTFKLRAELGGVLLCWSGPLDLPHKSSSNGCDQRGRSVTNRTPTILLR